MGVGSRESGDRRQETGVRRGGASPLAEQVHFSIISISNDSRGIHPLYRRYEIRNTKSEIIKHATPLCRHASAYKKLSADVTDDPRSSHTSHSKNYRDTIILLVTLPWAVAISTK